MSEIVLHHYCFLALKERNIIAVGEAPRYSLQQ